MFHALPNVNNEVLTDGSVGAHGIIGSLPFASEIVFPAIDKMLEIEGFWDENYGFYDSVNLEGENVWISERFYGIDKGLETLMANAYLSKDVQNAYMKHPIIKNGMRNLLWKKK